MKKNKSWLRREIEKQAAEEALKNQPSAETLAFYKAEEIRRKEESKKARIEMLEDNRRMNNRIKSYGTPAPNLALWALMGGVILGGGGCAD